MTLLTIPDPDALILQSIAPDFPDQWNRSIWTGKSQGVGLPGAELWSAQLAIEPLATEDEERPWRAFLFGLRGRANTFNLPLPCQHHNGGRPTVASGATNGYTLPLAGLLPNSRVLEAGHYMTVPLPNGHNRLVMLMADLVANGSGAATAQLNMALGQVPNTGATVETAKPFVPVRAAERRVPLSIDNAISGASFSVEEAL